MWQPPRKNIFFHEAVDLRQKNRRRRGAGTTLDENERVRQQKKKKLLLSAVSRALGKAAVAPSASYGAHRFLFHSATQNLSAIMILLLIVVASFVASIQGGRNCGTHPSMIYLKRGDKNSVEYWVPPPPPANNIVEPEMSLQSRLDEQEEEEQDVPFTPSTSTSSPIVELSTSTGGLTTWRTNDEEFAEWQITSSVPMSIKELTVSSEIPISVPESIRNVAEFKQEEEEEESTGFTGLKVSEDDVITTTTPHPTATSSSSQSSLDVIPEALEVNGHILSLLIPETNANQQIISDVTEFPAVYVTEPQTDIAPLMDDRIVANIQQSSFRPEQDEGSGVAPIEKLFTTESTPEEINMESITHSIQLMETKTKDELLDNLMKEEELRPHTTSRPEVKISSKNNESITIENSDLLLLHTVTTTETTPMTTQESTETATDSVQIEISKQQMVDSASSLEESSITSQLKDDFQDIAHILMAIPALPQAENQIKEMVEQLKIQQTEQEPESVTIADFKSDLHSAVDIHAEEIEPVTVSDDLLAKITGSQTEEPDIFNTESILPIRPEASSVQSLTKEMEEEMTTEQTISAGLAQFDGSGMDPIEVVKPELKTEGSGSFAIEMLNKIGDEVEGSGLNSVNELLPMIVESIMDEPEFKKAEENGPIEILGMIQVGDPFLVKMDSTVEGSGSSPPISDESIVDDEPPPEFRNDDVLINRIRTIVNSLTNPKDSSSSFLRRTSGLLQSVFKRTKRSIVPADVVNSPEFRQFLRSQPLPMRRALSPNYSGRFSRQMIPSNNRNGQQEDEDDGEECDLHIKTDPGLHLLLTFHNMSAPYTLDCAGAYVEIEREGNGFEARWCGKPIGERGVRSHVIFARSEVRVSVYNNKNKLLKHQLVTGGEGNNSLDSKGEDHLGPTGFSADIEVIDLHDAGQYTSFKRSEAYSNVHRRIG